MWISLFRSHDKKQTRARNLKRLQRCNGWAIGKGCNSRWVIRSLRSSEARLFLSRIISAKPQDPLLYLCTRCNEKLPDYRCQFVWAVVGIRRHLEEYFERMPNSWSPVVRPRRSAPRPSYISPCYYANHSIRERGQYVGQKLSPEFKPRLPKLGSRVVSVSATTPKPAPSFGRKTRPQDVLRQEGDPSRRVFLAGISRWLIWMGEGAAAFTERRGDAEALRRICRHGRQRQAQDYAYSTAERTDLVETIWRDFGPVDDAGRLRLFLACRSGTLATPA